MLINVRFVKPCVWAHAIGKHVAYKTNDEISVEDFHGYEMVKHGYAVLVEDNLNKPEYGEDESSIKSRKPRKSPENKMMPDSQEDKEEK